MKLRDQIAASACVHDQRVSVGAAAASGPRLAPTVTAGPVNANVFRGVPLVEVTEFVRHMSGRRLAGFFREALTKADCVIEASENANSPQSVGVSLPNQIRPRVNTGSMAQPHKGIRHSLKLELDRPVRLGIASEATKFGLKVSQYVADRLALHVGLPELVRELSQGTLASVTAGSDPNSRLDPDARYTMVRCDERVYERIQSRAAEHGQTPVMYVEKFCTELISGGTAAEIYGHQEVLAATG